MEIEAFLDISEEEMKKRIDEERRNLERIGILSRIEFLKERLKRFETPEWGLITCLLYNNQALLSQALNQYSNKRNDAKEAIMEELRQYYIHKEVLSAYQNIKKK